MSPGFDAHDEINPGTTYRRRKESLCNFGEILIRGCKFIICRPINREETTFMRNIALFASGNGTNAERIMEHFRNHPEIRVSHVFTNRPDAGVLKRAERMGVETTVFGKEDFVENGKVMRALRDMGVETIVLAGFLWLLPPAIVHEWSGRIINIHPALLPDFGGKGMFGAHVHRAVLESGRKESGITIHLVNDEYDKGKILFQARTEVTSGDTETSLAAKIQELEHRYFPEIVEKFILKQPING